MDRRRLDATVRSFMPPVVASVINAQHRARRHGTRAGWRLAKQLHSARLDLLPRDFDLRNGLVVDVGANIGEWSNAVLALAPTARLHAVEPNPDVFTQLRSRLGHLPDVVLHNVAVDERTGSALLHRTEASHNTSLAIPRDDAGSVFGWGWDVADTVEVPTSRLDDLLPAEPVSLLKIDVQGHELPLLRGAKEVLARTRGVLLEVTLQRHYAGDAGFEDLHRAMVTAGFGLVALSRPDLSQDGRIAWLDACYLRDGEPADRPGLLARYGRGLGS